MVSGSIRTESRLNVYGKPKRAHHNVGLNIYPRLEGSSATPEITDTIVANY